MSSNRDKIYELLNDIETLIRNNETENGTLRLDDVRVMVALDFAKTEIEKAIATAK